MISSTVRTGEQIAAVSEIPLSAVGHASQRRFLDCVGREPLEELGGPIGLCH